MSDSRTYLSDHSRSLILTPTSCPPRTLIPSLRSLPSLSIASQLTPITVIYSSIPRFISATSPLFIRNILRLEPYTYPAAYNAFAFLASTVELFVKLPLETVLRRAQGSLLQKIEDDQSQTASRKSDTKHQEDSQFKPVIPVGPYKGVVGTLWYIVREEGASKSATQTVNFHAHQKGGRTSQPTAKGQGPQGLFRGWRVGMWGLVGVWGAAVLGGNSSGGEF